jgi:hypothetical protein
MWGVGVLWRKHRVDVNLYFWDLKVVLKQISHKNCRAHTIVVRRRERERPDASPTHTLTHSFVHSLSTHSFRNHSSYVNLSFKTFIPTIIYLFIIIYYKGGASNQALRMAQIFFLKSDIHFIRQFLHQTEFQTISKRHLNPGKWSVFWTYVMLFLGSETFQKKFVTS